MMRLSLEQPFKRTQRIKSLKHKINKGTQLVMKLEQAIRLILNELAMISSNLRQLEHASTAVFNPYAAQIMNETIQRFVPMGPKSRRCRLEKFT